MDARLRRSYRRGIDPSPVSFCSDCGAQLTGRYCSRCGNRAHRSRAVWILGLGVATLGLLLIGGAVALLVAGGQTSEAAKATPTAPSGPMTTASTPPATSAPPATTVAPAPPPPDPRLTQSNLQEWHDTQTPMVSTAQRWTASLHGCLEGDTFACDQPTYAPFFRAVFQADNVTQAFYPDAGGSCLAALQEYHRRLKDEMTILLSLGTNGLRGASDSEIVQRLNLLSAAVGQVTDEYAVVVRDC